MTETNEFVATLKALKRQHEFYLAKKVSFVMVSNDAVKVTKTGENFTFVLDMPGEFNVTVTSNGKELDADQIVSICDHMEKIRQDVLDDKEDSSE